MNPYAAPVPHAENAVPRGRHPFALLMLGIGFGHFFSHAGEVPNYATLVSVGALSPLSAVMTVIACLLFYAAAFQMFATPARAKTLYLCAAVAFGMAAATLGGLFMYTSVVVSAFPQALLGFWLAFRMQKQQEKSA